MALEEESALSAALTACVRFRRRAAGGVPGMLFWGRFWPCPRFPLPVSAETNPAGPRAGSGRGLGEAPGP